MNIIHTMNCQEHPCTELIEDLKRGDVICPECGLVILDRCIFGNEHLDIVLENDESFGLNHIRIDDYVAKLNLPDRIKYEAVKLYPKISGILRSKSIETKSCVAVLIASRRRKMTRSFAELSLVTGLREAVICRNLKIVEEELGGNPDLDRVDEVIRYASLLNLPFQKAMEVAELYEAEIVKGRNPRSILGACFYKVVDGRVDEISQIISISKATITKTYKILFKK